MCFYTFFVQFPFRVFLNNVFSNLSSCRSSTSFVQVLVLIVVSQAALFVLEMALAKEEIYK